jgi:O-antigen/teichoic acid export membrane protein
MDQNSLAYKTFKNSGFTFFNYIFPVVFAIFITPVIVHKLGVADYGLYILVNTIIGFLGFIDLGLAAGVFRYIVKYRALNDFQALQRLIDASNILYLALGLFGFLVFAVLGKFFLSAFHIAPSAESRVFAVFFLAGVLFFINTISAIFYQIPSALQRYDIGVTINLAKLTAFNLLVLALMLSGFRLKAVMLVSVIVSAAVTAVYWRYAAKLLPEIRFGLKWDFEQVKKCYNFGMAFFTTNFFNNAVSNLDRLIIPVFTGPVALPFYSLPGNVGEKINGVMGSLSVSLYPLATSLDAAGKLDQLKAIYLKAIRNLSVLGAAMVVPVMLLADKILYFWLGPELAAKSAVILIILAPTNFLMGLYTVLMGFPLAMGKVNFLMKFSGFMAVLNVLLVIVTVHYWGILGVAWAYLASVLPVIWMVHYVERKILNFPSLFWQYVKLYAKICFTALVLCLPVVYIIRPLATSLWSLIILGPCSVLLFLVLYKIFGFFEAEDWGQIKNFIMHLKSKLFI